MQKTLTIIIPFKKPEPHLGKTILEVMNKYTGAVRPRIEVMEDKGENLGMRQMINKAVEMTDTKYIMKLDAHCLLDEGFDEKLIADSKPNKVQIPVRYRLDVDKWQHYGNPVYREQLVYEAFKAGYLWGAPWNEAGETMHFQGSCWFMTKEWFKKCGLLRTEGYGGWADEPEEIYFETIKNGGEVKINLKTFYAHWHKPKELCYPVDVSKNRRYSFDYWTKDNKEFFINWLKKFMPIPGWEKDWEKLL